MPTAKNNPSSRAGGKKERSEHTLAARPSPQAKQTAIEKEMALYRITRVPVDYFHLGSYRYTNLADALAQAKREYG